MRRFGLIGFPLSHSFSQRYFTEKFTRENIDGCVYENFSIPSIDELPGILAAHMDLRGLNVTIPYKEKVIPFLDQVDEVVRETGACNCIRIVYGKLHGFNTDVTGFRVSLQEKLLPAHRPALVLGKGGAAKAVAFVLRQLGIGFMFVVRRSDGEPDTMLFGDIDRQVIQDHPLIINTTPLGTFPDVDTAPAIPYHYITPQHYLYDLVYNPAETTFLRRGKERGAVVQNGSDMLVIQAEESWTIWNR